MRTISPVIERTKIEVYRCRCEQCGHEWTTEGLTLPKRCTNHACRARQWTKPTPTTRRGRPQRPVEDD
jgi:predicted Zn-ribbon and HTH transcriptional regulator